MIQKLSIQKMRFLQGSLRLVCLGFILFASIANPSYAAAKTEKAVPKGRETKASKTDRTEKRSAASKNSSPDRRRADDKRKAVTKAVVKALPKTSANGTRGVPKATSRNTARSRTNERENAGSRERERVSSKERDRNGSAVAKRQRAIELQRVEARRRAEAERLATITRERSRDEELRDKVQSMIAKDDLTGEDPEIRRAAVNALGNHAGTVVVMNPHTGRIYSMVNQEWAVREGFKPCSTIKLVTGLAGLNENVIDSNDTTKISDTNQMSLTKALAYSKNEYFQQVGGQVGYDKMISYARRLGLGEKTGINARNEFQGHLPSLKSGFALNRMASHGDDFQVTALQLATLVSAMANGGKLLTPYVAHTRQQETNFKVKVRRQVKIDPDAWQHMVPGMVGAVNYGSGRRAHDPGHTVVGKTGTCLEQGNWVGLFTSYAPLADPRLAVVVIARGADGQSHFPAAVAGRIYRDLNSRLGAPATLQVAKAREMYAPERSVFETDDEASEEATAMNTNSNSLSRRQGTDQTHSAQPLLGNTIARASNSVRPVLMQIPKRNQEPGKTTVRSNIASNSSEGQTRPRRVFTER